MLVLSQKKNKVRLKGLFKNIKTLGLSQQMTIKGGTTSHETSSADGVIELIYP